MDLLKYHKGVFIAGTDTSVGKTFFACHWIRYLVQKGIRVGVMKPVETGVGPEKRSDGFLLRKAAQSKVPLPLISPYRFKLAVAPRIASVSERRKIRIPYIVKLFRQMAASHDCMIVEGAGGLMVPVQKGVYMADLIKVLDLPVVLVAADKLGTVNHTLLSCHYARTKGLTVSAIILNQRKGGADLSCRSNSRLLKECIDIPVFTFHYPSDTVIKTTLWAELSR